MPASRTAPNVLWIPAYAVGAVVFLGLAGLLDLAIVIGEDYSDHFGYTNLPSRREIPTLVLSVVALTGFSFCAARLVRPRSRLASLPRVARPFPAAILLCAASNLLLLWGTSPETAETGRWAAQAAAPVVLAGAVASIAALALSRRDPVPLD